MVQSQQITHLFRGTEHCDKGLIVEGRGQRHVGVVMIGVFAVFLSVSRQEPAAYHSLGDNSFLSDTLKFITNQEYYPLWL